jgi:hypothetical protein
MLAKTFCIVWFEHRSTPTKSKCRPNVASAVARSLAPAKWADWAVMAFALNRGTARRKKHCHPSGSAT